MEPLPITSENYCSNCGQDVFENYCGWCDREVDADETEEDDFSDNSWE